MIRLSYFILGSLFGLAIGSIFTHASWFPLAVISALWFGSVIFEAELKRRIDQDD